LYLDEGNEERHTSNPIKGWTINLPSSDLNIADDQAKKFFLKKQTLRNLHNTFCFTNIGLGCFSSAFYFKKYKN